MKVLKRNGEYEDVSFDKVLNRLKKIYYEQFSETDIFKIPKVEKDYNHAYHLYPLQIDFDKKEQKRNKTYIKSSKSQKQNG